MLLTAGLVAIVFGKLKQPIVLGYILAGFIRSWAVCLLIGAALILAVLFVMRSRARDAEA